VYKTFYAWTDDNGNLQITIYLDSTNPNAGMISLTLDKAALAEAETGLSNAYHWARDLRAKLDKEADNVLPIVAS
jgi:hypothetical protein